LFPDDPDFEGRKYRWLDKLINLMSCGSVEDEEKDVCVRNSRIY